MREHSDIKIYTSAGWKSLKTAQVYTSAGWKTFGCGSTGCAVYAMGDWNRIQAETYTISYFLNSGTNASGAPTSYTANDLPLTLPTPTRSGYTFGGWYTNSGLTTSAGTTIPAGSTGNKTFYAKWTATAPPTAQYIVCFKVEGMTVVGSMEDSSGSSYLHGSFSVRIDDTKISSDGNWGVYSGQMQIGYMEDGVELTISSGSHSFPVEIRFNENTVRPKQMSGSTMLNISYSINGGSGITVSNVPMTFGGSTSTPPVLLFTVPVSNLPSGGATVYIEITSTSSQNLAFKSA